MNYLATEEYKIRSKNRGIIEHKNAEMKRYHGLLQQNTVIICHDYSVSLSAITVNIKESGS